MSFNPPVAETDPESVTLRALPVPVFGLNGRLPAALSPIVGREHEIATVAHLLLRPDVRLVTLTGPAGAGKTRLALQVAEDLFDDFADGAVMVELAQVRNPDLVPNAVAEALRLVERVGQSPADSVRAHLRDRSVLLVLDNFEHLLPAAPQLTEWLASCRGLTILATSRAVLRVSGEHDLQVLPLEIPDLECLPSYETLRNIAAVQLFVARATAARHDFALTPDNAETIASICVRLDGLPLAIELAAARMQHLSPQALFARLDRRLSLLSGGPFDQPERLRTLENAIAWSYELLTGSEQELIQGLSVFVGGFGLDAAEAIWGDDCGVLDGIASLVRKSLLHQDPHADDEPRYRMLQTIQEFALDRLHDSGKFLEIRRDHARYFVELAERVDDAVWGGPNHRMWLDRLELDLPNLRAALAWLDESNEHALLLRLSAALGGLWHYRSHRIEGRAWLIRALNSETPEVSFARATAMVKLAMLELDLSGTLRADLAYEALALRRTLGAERPIGRTLLMVARILEAQGDLKAAKATRSEAAEIFARIDDKFGLAWCSFKEGVDARNAGDTARARASMFAALSLFRQDGFPFGVTQVLITLGKLEAEWGNSTEAAGHYLESVRLWNETLSKEQLVDTVAGAGRLVGGSGKPADAVRLLSFAASLGTATGYVGAPGERELDDRMLQAARARLGEAWFEEIRSASAACSVETMLVEADVLLTAFVGKEKPEFRGRAPAPGGLTKRELSVVRLLTQGLSNREIAQDLFISESTTITHVSNIMAKLAFPSRTAVAAWAIHQGLG